MLGRRKGRIFTLQLRGDLLREMEDRGVADEVGEDEVRDPRLAHSREVAGAADPEVMGMLLLAYENQTHEIIS